MVVVVAGVAFLSACRALTPRETKAPHDHVLMFDTDGQAADPTGNHACASGVRGSASETKGSVEDWCNGKQWSLRGQPWLSDELFERQREDILAGLRSYAEAGNQRRLLIFIHGGLNARGSSLERAERLVGLIEQENGAAGAYPLFVNWRSSLRSSYRDHLFLVRQGKRYGPKAAVAAPFIFFGDIARGILHIPLALGNEIKNALRGCNRCALNEHVLGVEHELVEENHGGGGIQLQPGELCTTPASTTARTLSLVATTPTVKLLTAPTIDTIGASAWSIMRRRTRLLLVTEDEFRKQEMIPSIAGTFEPQGHLSIFLRELSDFLKAAEEDGEPWTVDLVGHSMGTIVINEIIREHGDHLQVSNIVYMAAACSLEDYHHTIIPYLETHEAARMFHLTLHPKADIRERNFWDLPPRGSLLVWLDDFLTKSETPFERRAGRYDNLLRIVHLTPPAVADQISIRAFGLGKCLSEQPQKHGDFGERLRFWDPNCWSADHSADEGCYDLDD